MKKFIWQVEVFYGEEPVKTKTITTQATLQGAEIAEAFCELKNHISELTCDDFFETESTGFRIISETGQNIDLEKCEQQGLLRIKHDF